MKPSSIGPARIIASHFILKKPCDFSGQTFQRVSSISQFTQLIKDFMYKVVPLKSPCTDVMKAVKRRKKPMINANHFKPMRTPSF